VKQNRLFRARLGAKVHIASSTRSADPLCGGSHNFYEEKWVPDAEVRDLIRGGEMCANCLKVGRALGKLLATEAPGEMHDDKHDEEGEQNIG
jgi:hypothetical protein